MRRNKTILDVLREAQGQPAGKTKGRGTPREKTPGGRTETEISEEEKSLSFWHRGRAWVRENPALGGGLSLGLLFLLVFALVRWGGGSQELPPEPGSRGGPSGAGLASHQKGPSGKPAASHGNTPRLMGGGGLSPTAETVSNEAARAGREKKRTGGLKPETWTTRKLRFFRISSYKNPKTTVIGYASSMARYLRKKGFKADHAWLKKKDSKQLIVYVQIPAGASRQQEAQLFERLRSLGFVRKPKDRVDLGFQFDFRKLKKNIGRAKFRVRVGVGQKGS